MRHFSKKRQIMLIKYADIIKLLLPTYVCSEMRYQQDVLLRDELRPAS